MRFGDSCSEQQRPFSLVVLAVACLAAWIVAIPAASAKRDKAKPAGSFKIDFWTFDRGNGWVTATAEATDRFDEETTGRQEWHARAKGAD